LAIVLVPLEIWPIINGLSRRSLTSLGHTRRRHEVENDAMSKVWVIRRALGRRVSGNVGISDWQASESTEGGRL